MDRHINALAQQADADITAARLRVAASDHAVEVYGELREDLLIIALEQRCYQGLATSRAQMHGHSLS